MTHVNGHGPVNGHGAVDLGAMKAVAQQREQVNANRGQIIAQRLMQAGLMCPCGERIRGDQVIYFILVDETIATPNGPQVNIAVASFVFHSHDCRLAIAAERTAVARRDGLFGEVIWLDEEREARAARAARDN